MTYSRTSLANRACDLVGKDALLDLDTDTSAWAKVMLRNYDPVFKRCLRKSQWSWAVVRLALNPNLAAPVNEFSFTFNVPADCEKLIRVFPDGTRYKREGDMILADESPITVKYVSNASLLDPSVIDPSFAEYFAHELAVAVSYKATDSVALRNELKEAAGDLFREAAALFSQEDTEDELEESPWVTARYGAFDEGTIKIAGLE